MKKRHENNLKIYERKFTTFTKMNELLSRIIKQLENEDYLDKEDLEGFFDLLIEME